jgi:signal transduction histidine kinase
VLDDGIGYPENMQYGNGIRNMQRRAMTINAILVIPKVVSDARVVFGLTV